LASYAATQIKRNFIFWKGYCPTHIKILPEYINQAKEKYPDAKVLVHPECVEGAIAVADGVFSTGGMSKYVKESDATSFIIGTENGMIYRLQRDNPDKKFYDVTELAVCPNMKKTTLDKVLKSLQTEEYEITLDKEIIEKAQKSIKAMFKYV
jgi:quinolinate synthase